MMRSLVTLNIFNNDVLVQLQIIFQELLMNIAEEFLNNLAYLLIVFALNAVINFKN
jgi:hypothetical protein